jgi:hypothetical protein
MGTAVPLLPLYALKARRETPLPFVCYIFNMEALGCLTPVSRDKIL